ncbi:uncharacterized protein LOC116348187 isoform X2 [Contarinia nasturtii]|uniref:uncharacterized protein LOC116348187 isoform X2 n=1 Tax=Contarinia nasturtii TaxID=265458 RepID=UPI0012D4B7F7|nr:uncharacterized protein LOC116348187 isoform X2 [Contarinia nasturtii]
MAIGEENQQKCVLNRNAPAPTAPPPDYYTLFPSPLLVPNSQPNATFIPITPHEYRLDNHNVQNEVTIDQNRGNVVTSVPVQNEFTQIEIPTAVSPQADTTSTTSDDVRICSDSRTTADKNSAKPEWQ